MSHQQAIDDLKVISEDKKSIADRVVSSIMVKVMLMGDMEQLAKMKKVFIGKVLKETDSTYTETSKLGKSFADEKIDAAKP